MCRVIREMADNLGVSLERESIRNTILFEAHSQKNMLKKVKV